MWSIKFIFHCFSPCMWLHSISCYSQSPHWMLALCATLWLQSTDFKTADIQKASLSLFHSRPIFIFHKTKSSGASALRNHITARETGFKVTSVRLLLPLVLSSFSTINNIPAKLLHSPVRGDVWSLCTATLFHQTTIPAATSVKPIASCAFFFKKKP